MDWWGLCIIVPGLPLVVCTPADGGYAPSGWRTPYIYIAVVVGILFLGAAAYVEGWISAQSLLLAELLRPNHMKRLIAALFLSGGTLGFCFPCQLRVSKDIYPTDWRNPLNDP
ncbi:hypothetical protein B0J13DRAFT_138360 [Dactylonectria estremocensis]|uniref:Uncharacterized protein n=1 Tax=Dactylonectria estremocensis TaxID=1079267 RepID=A0A9P9ISH9_9HYPO|nr:hypothetical protein B0J13DRAFT_138360 [Dactylonectria estremocensis]